MNPCNGELPYYTLPELCAMFGYKHGTAKNKVSDGTFQVPTYKLGKNIVADKAVVAAWFEKQRERGLAEINKPTSTSRRHAPRSRR